MTDLALWWIRRDLRLRDNPALAVALEGGRAVLPVFVLDERLLRRPAPARQAFLFEGLRRLESDLRARGGQLVVRRGPPEEALAGLMAESGATAVYALEDASPYAIQRDARVAARLPLHLLPGITVHPLGLVRKPDGGPYSTYSGFRRAWLALPFPSGDAPAGLSHFPTLPAFACEPIPQVEAGKRALDTFPPGEEEAQRRLERFCDTAIYAYHEDRNRLDLEGTSGLSPYLRFGMLSARQSARGARLAMERRGTDDARRGPQAWLDELIWREFYLQILLRFPEVLKGAFQARFTRLPWRDDPQGLRAWQEGLTGYPAVDAGMRQLQASGWMHNRARMLVASFLAKDLLIDWREGEAWFMRCLVDGDPAANNGGWQWAAGTGSDAAPYFRIFNPVLQGEKFDPLGDYVRRWVPELVRVPRAFVQRPWEMPEEEQRRAGCRIGRDYPAPIVDHGLARQRALAAYRSTTGVKDPDANGTRTSAGDTDQSFIQGNTF
jgi:deoxyribodipyrimidine photo-lyase